MQKQVFLQPNFSYSSLDKIRKRLLDISNRNVLLNYRFPPKKSLQIGNTNASNITNMILEEKSLTFIPTPRPTIDELKEVIYIDEKKEKENIKYPTAREWARYLGYHENVNFSEEDKEDNSSTLQTFLYLDQLEEIVKTIKRESTIAFEEMGANILFLCFGFLEWYESNTSDQKMAAPLYLIPVKFNEDASKHSISLVDDGCIYNLSLKEKLKIEFGIELPIFSADDNILPGEYINLVRKEVISKQPRWEIKEQGYLALLNFSKQAMFLDLAPERWSNAKYNLENHPIIEKLFRVEGQEDKDTNSYINYDFDKDENIHQKYPLVLDADSSQHQVLIEILNRNSLVVEGPPGSGKSQTITNLIAACLNQGLKVLFVAEKMAALSVVKERLDSVGLGDFCLELHSHKMKKSEVSKSLELQLEKLDKYKYEDINKEIKLYERYKDNLSSYVSTIHSEWEFTGKTIFEILNRASRLKLELSLKSIPKLHINNPNKLDKDFIENIMDEGYLLDNIYKSILPENGIICDNPWYGLKKINIFQDDENVINTLLDNLNNSLINLEKIIEKIEENYKVKNIETLQELEDITYKLGKLPPLKGDEDLSIFKYLIEENAIDNSINLLEVYEETHKLFNNLEDKITKHSIFNSDTYREILIYYKKLINIGYNDCKTLEEISQENEKNKKLLGYIEKYKEIVKEIKPILPEELSNNLEYSVDGVKLLIDWVNIINSLPKHLWKKRNEIFNTYNFEDIFLIFKEKYQKNLNIFKKLDKKLYLDAIPDNIEEIIKDVESQNGIIYKLFSSRYKNSKNKIISLYKDKSNSIDNIIPLLLEAIKLKKYLSELNEFCYKNELNFLYDGMETNLEELDILNNWYKELHHLYGLGFGVKAKMAKSLSNLDSSLAFSLIEEVNPVLHQLSEIDSLIHQQIEYYSKLSSFSKLDFDFSSDANFIIKNIYEETSSSLNCLEVFITDSKIRLGDIKEVCNTLEKINKNSSIFNSKKRGLLYFDKLYCEHGKFNREKLESLKYILNIAISLKETDLLPSISNKEITFNENKYNKLNEIKINIDEKLDEAKINILKFINYTDLDIDKWNIKKDSKIEDIINKNKLALSNIDKLSTWSQYISKIETLNKLGLQEITSLLDDKTQKNINISKIIELSIYYTLSLEIFEKNKHIREFSEITHENYIEKFKECDKNLMGLQRKQIAYNCSKGTIVTGVNSGPVKGYTEKSLILREASKQKAHIPIRSLLQRSHISIQALKPCFMMSPISVAQYLPPDKFHFDVVIMDEASQILPEDAIGVIARGSTVAIVGDSKQLPPTNFFRTGYEAEEAEEDVSLQESESILEAVSGMLKTCQLNWHYRSRHESLIAFSNKHFYDSKLVIFPSPFQECEEFGIKYTKVEGIYKENKNIPEAKLIANKAAELIKKGTESVGIISMNSEQRDEIENQFELILKEDKELSILYEKNNKQLFIKNLENVQGDERDIILISMTYGPENIGDRVYQRFGPINKNSGWRRLNVLFTRAKKRMHIYSSMNSSDIVLSSTSSKGVTTLRAFLEYCEKGHLHNIEFTGKLPDSDFEISVMEELAKYGYQCEPQLGVAGFYLDLAVKNPHNEGQFLMGIECDGATYHSTKSARERDRLRQEILENLGWKIHRIWSTDWFRNPEKQIKRLLEKLDLLSEKNRKRKNLEAEENKVEIFNNEINNLNEPEQCNLIFDCDLPSLTYNSTSITDK